MGFYVEQFTKENKAFLMANRQKIIKWLLWEEIKEYCNDCGCPVDIFLENLKTEGKTKEDLLDDMSGDLNDKITEIAENVMVEYI